MIHSVIAYDEDDLGDTLDEQAAERGLEAWRLAVALRHEHGVEEADTVWNYAKGLEDTLQKARQAKKERSEQDAENAREMAERFSGTHDRSAEESTAS